MSQIDDPTFENKVRLAGMGLVALCSLYVPPLAFHMIGLDAVLLWLEGCPGLVRWPVFLILWGLSFIALMGVVRGLFSFIEQLIPLCINAAARIGEFTAQILTILVLSVPALVGQLLKLALYPVRLLCEAAIEQGRVRLGLYLQNWREEQELRRLWQREFRAEFRTFKNFKRHFHAGTAGGGNAGANEQRHDSEPPRPEPPKPDPFKAACRILGLPEDGAFTAAELKKRYLTLIKGVHPDIAGPNELAAQINAACTLIRERKGWT
jgi:hypothetical protein